MKFAKEGSKLDLFISLGCYVCVTLTHNVKTGFIFAASDSVYLVPIKNNATAIQTFFYMNRLKLSLNTQFGSNFLIC